MKSQIRDLVAEALYPTSANVLPAVCERLGLEPGTTSDAFRSKRVYVVRRLEKLSIEEVLTVAKRVVEEYPDDKLQAAIELLEKEGKLVSDITRRDLAEALNGFPLAGRDDVLEKHWPEIALTDSFNQIAPLFYKTLTGNTAEPTVQEDDRENSEVLEQVGFLTCSQAKLFRFLEDVVHPIRQDHKGQEQIVAALNPILQRDGYWLVPTDRVSGYPVYRVRETTVTSMQPSDELISEVLSSFDEIGVHDAWRKALERRASDPEGAITSARTLLETVCKHIIEEAGDSYGRKDDLPKLYNTAAEYLNLAPSQHSEEVFRSILGNCQSVVGNLAAVRNKLGDSHGQGKRHVRPQPRHAELAVNLAGSMAMFLISTWNQRKRDGM
ncbi:MAG: abortive infection family protein [Truepera sp.]|nr:abortive infection family protein [Truepera sp.]